MTGAFPSNTELEVELTFALQPGAGGGGGVGEEKAGKNPEKLIDATHFERYPECRP